MNGISISKKYHIINISKSFVDKMSLKMYTREKLFLKFKLGGEIK